MRGKWMFRLLILLPILVVCHCMSVWAASPWTKLLTPNQINADPDKQYTLKEENGPWTIMACSFTGEGAEKQAHDLVLELRKRYRLEAYIHKANFKLDDPNAPGSESLSPIRWQYRRFKDNPEMRKRGGLEEVAVVVGNYQAVDDPEAQKTLQKLKYADPDCLKIAEGKPVARPLAGLRMMQKEIQKRIGNEAAKKGPLGHAFVTTNPLLPADYYAPKGAIDELVLKMNKNVAHSLLDCPGKYTVQVAHFTGEVTIDQREIEDIEHGKTSMAKKTGQDRSPLAIAAEKAHVLTDALRLKGYEAYEFHDRYASIVTVGSFDSVGLPRDDGKIEINPKIHAIMKTFGGDPMKIPGQPPGAMSLKTLVDIPFDLQPIPVMVPKRSISRELARRIDDR